MAFAESAETRPLAILLCYLFSIHYSDLMSTATASRDNVLSDPDRFEKSFKEIFKDFEGRHRHTLTMMVGMTKSWAMMYWDLDEMDRRSNRVIRAVFGIPKEKSLFPYNETAAQDGSQDNTETSRKVCNCKSALQWSLGCNVRRELPEGFEPINHLITTDEASYHKLSNALFKTLNQSLRQGKLSLSAFPDPEELPSLQFELDSRIAKTFERLRAGLSDIDPESKEWKGKMERDLYRCLLKGRWDPLDTLEKGWFLPSEESLEEARKSAITVPEHSSSEAPDDAPDDEDDDDKTLVDEDGEDGWVVEILDHDDNEKWMGEGCTHWTRLFEAQD